MEAKGHEMSILPMILCTLKAARTAEELLEIAYGLNALEYRLFSRLMHLTRPRRISFLANDPTHYLLRNRVGCQAIQENTERGSHRYIKIHQDTYIYTWIVKDHHHVRSY
jgi:hypothetical protein